MKARRIPGGAARAFALAVACALLIPGGGAVGFHSSGGGRFVKHIHPPYADARSFDFQSCNVLLECRSESAADKSNGNMSVSGSIEPRLVMQIGPGFIESTSSITATDELRRAARRRGYTLVFHVHRADFNNGQAYAYLLVDATHSDGAESHAFVGLASRHEGQDVPVFLDFDAIGAGTITIEARLIGEAVRGTTSLPAVGDTIYDVEATLTQIDVFR